MYVSDNNGGGRVYRISKDYNSLHNKIWETLSKI